MTQPTIQIQPGKPAVCTDASVTLDVLLKITPPVPETAPTRPALNLGIVLDRSGSMGSENKIDYARQAAAFVVQQLQATDRVGVTVFDDVIETVVSSTLAEDKAGIVSRIQGIQPRNMTALHGGWREGARQVQEHRLENGLNRVLLLSDGLANVGETNNDIIGTDVRRFSQENVTTTTLGLGDDYNEDLLEAMALCGDGNYYYVESPDQLPAIFQTELQGLMATLGTGVTLNVDPQGDVTMLDVLNDLEKTPEGDLQLPNMIAGMPIPVLIRLVVPPRHTSEERLLCRFHLGWTVPKSSTRMTLEIVLQLPAAEKATWSTLASNLDVEEQAILLLITRTKKQATDCLARMDVEGAKRLVEEAKRMLASAPKTLATEQEAQALAAIEADLSSGSYLKFQKRAKYQSYSSRLGKSL